MVVEQRYAWGRAYRDGKLVCGRVHLTVGRDDRVGLARHERRYLRARFLERVDPTLRRELGELARRRGAAARRVAETVRPIAVVIDDARRGRQRFVVWVQPPDLRYGDLREIEFVLRELPVTW
jgi:hypothetical protein